MDFEGGERETLAKLASGDPRFAFAVTQMQRREAELKAMYETVFLQKDARAFQQERNTIVRKHVGKIPATVAKALDATNNARDSINGKINVVARAALLAISRDCGRQIST